MMSKMDSHGDSDKEFVIELTGGPKKVFRQRTVRNPLYKKTKTREAIIELSWYGEMVRSLVLARHQRYLTQRQLASILKTKQSAISTFEQGRTNPTLSFLIRHAKTLGYSLQIKLRKIS